MTIEVELMRKALFLTSVLFLSACSSGEVNGKLHADATPANIKYETAKYFATSTSRVRVGNMKPGMLGTAYNAKVSGKVYDCRYFKKTVTCSRA